MVSGNADRSAVAQYDDPQGCWRQQVDACAGAEVETRLMCPS